MLNNRQLDFFHEKYKYILFYYIKPTFALVSACYLATIMLMILETGVTNQFQGNNLTLEFDKINPGVN